MNIVLGDVTEYCSWWCQ